MKSRNLIFPKIEKENKEIRKRAIKAVNNIKKMKEKNKIKLENGSLLKKNNEKMVNLSILLHISEIC